MTDKTLFPPLLDLPADQLEAQKQHLMSEIDRPPERQRLPWTSVLPFTFAGRRSGASRLATLATAKTKLAFVAVVVAAAALALVPVGGASLGARAVDGIVNLWATQNALDAAAEDAQSIAGSSYFTGAAINQDANTVDLYLKAAPQSVIDQLNTQHPGVYVIHNDAPNTNAELLKLTAAFDETPLQEKGIRVTGWGPTGDGYLQVGVTADVATAQSILDKIYGPNVIRVYKDEPAIPA